MARVLHHRYNKAKIFWMVLVVQSLNLYMPCLLIVQWHLCERNVFLLLIQVQKTLRYYLLVSPAGGGVGGGHSFFLLLILPLNPFFFSKSSTKFSIVLLTPSIPFSTS